MICICLCFALTGETAKAQHYVVKSVFYNTLIGGISGSVGALINKRKEEKWKDVLLKNFIIGSAGGAVVFGAKRMNSLIATQKNLSYAWLSRSVFCAGTSIVENASTNRPFWSVWHYDIGFMRFEYNVDSHSFNPKIMPSSFGATVFLALHAHLDVKTSLQSGIPTFRTRVITYQPSLSGSTVTNGILLSDTLTKGKGSVFFDTYAHEMVHTFQFEEFVGLNHWFKPLTDKWDTESATFKKMHKWIYGDVNYECMLINYFLIQGGSTNHYCRNFLENEAEELSVGRTACDMK